VAEPKQRDRLPRQETSFKFLSNWAEVWTGSQKIEW